jgi:hypothetical protein
MNDYASELILSLINEYKKLIDKFKDKHHLNDIRKKIIYKREISEYIRINSLSRKQTKLFKEKINTLYQYYNINFLPHQMQINYILNILETRNYNKKYENKDYLMYTDHGYTVSEIETRSQKYIQLLQSKQSVLYNEIQLQQYTQWAMLYSNSMLVNNLLYFDENSGMYYFVYAIF